MYNDNSGMYHEPRHKLYYTGTTVIVLRIKQYINDTLETKYLGDLCWKIFINLSTRNVNMSILASIQINKYLVVHECLYSSLSYSIVILFSESRNI